MQTPANKDIRQFITKYFKDADLEIFCSDYFPEVQDNFTLGMEKNIKIVQLMQYCRHRELMPNLLGNLQKERPQPYKTTFSLQETVTAPPLPPKPKPHDPNQIFISHATADASDLANKLAADLRANGHPVWIAPTSIAPGEKWGEAIERGLQESGIFVLLLTPAAVNSHWVKIEMQAAMLLHGLGQMRILPLDVQTCDVPLFWQTYHFLDFRDKYESGWSRLRQALDGTPVKHAQPEPEKLTPPAEPILDQCTATTKSGSRCRNEALAGTDYCDIHTKKPKAKPPQTPPPRIETVAAQQPPVTQSVPNNNSFIHEKTELEFVRIPAEEFIYSLGKTGRKEVTKEVKEKKGFFRTEVRYVTEYEDVFEEGRIELPEFWMSKTPVTNAIYKRFVTDWKYDSGKENHPVVEVNWYEAVAFCEWAGLALPTEEQWEKAARGTDGRQYPWGNSDPTDKLCNFDENVGTTTPVGNYSPQGDSPYGCVDMSGNVWEWCLNKYNTPEDTSIDKSDDLRVLRGGAYWSDAGASRAACRGSYSPGDRANYYGFRVVVARRPPSQ